MPKNEVSTARLAAAEYAVLLAESRLGQSETEANRKSLSWQRAELYKLQNQDMASQLAAALTEESQETKEIRVAFGGAEESAYASVNGG